jgi:hypothetical protein
MAERLLITPVKSFMAQAPDVTQMQKSGNI